MTPKSLAPTPRDQSFQDLKVERLKGGFHESSAPTSTRTSIAEDKKMKSKACMECLVGNWAVTSISQTPSYKGKKCSSVDFSRASRIEIYIDKRQKFEKNWQRSVSGYLVETSVTKVIEFLNKKATMHGMDRLVDHSTIDCLKICQN